MSEASKFTAEKKTSNVDVYHVPSTDAGGWTRVYIDHDCAGIQFIGDYISGGYRFGSIGPDTMQEFLLGCDFHYFMKKTMHGRYLEFNADKTQMDHLQLIIDWRRDTSLTKEQAREFYDHIISIETSPTMDENEFFRELLEYEGIYDFFADGPYAQYDISPTCQMFWDGPWQAFCDLWRTEIAAKKELVAA